MGRRNVRICGGDSEIGGDEGSEGRVGGSEVDDKI